MLGFSHVDGIDVTIVVVYIVSLYDSPFRIIGDSQLVETCDADFL